MRIVVEGAGIGGLAAGLCLAGRGLEPLLLEQSPTVRAVGAGITVQPNAMRVLDALGLADAVEARGQRLRRGGIRNATGGTISEFDLTDARSALGWDPRLVAIHRADLVDVLAAALGQDRLRCDARVTGYAAGPSGVQVVLASDEVLRADVLVGAGGLHSRVRVDLAGEEPPRYSGYTGWRGIAPLVGGWDPERSVEFWGAGERFGIAPIGRDRVYWFATANAPPGQSDPRGAKAAVLHRFGSWADPIPALVEATPADDVLHHDIVDRPFLERWGEGRTTLLGDAAHAMTPNMGQGACQAIEDGWVLARALAEHADPAEGLRAYERARRERARWFVDQSRQIGALGQWEGAAARWVRDLGVWIGSSLAGVAPFRKAWEFEL